MTQTELNPGICSVTLRALGIDEVVRTAAAAGLAGIEWGSDVHVHDAASAERARTSTEAAGLTVLSLGSYYRAGSFGNFDGVLALAAKLGAPRIRMWAGDVGSAEAKEAEWDAVVEDTQRTSGLAAARGMEVAFEYHGGTLTDSPETTLELLRRVDRPNVGTYWQPAVGLSDQQAIESLRQVIEHVVGVHCFSWWPAQERLPLEDRGELWRAVADVVRGHGRDMDMMLEFVEGDLPSNVLRDAGVLRRITAEATNF
ncbi:sugar phosphate isomerase/epimerase family protein [Arthrobacter sp. B2a2-09]|uniref:sugar phosphate isomerase/epimerase family protein n=1 Tax=Arthrobacter sp. B2a2-09 TaxID=2952822 RepID=UPI0022CD4330|nr:TIM barrel protein [Arthrobacter sp. B2a2-09]MCZ9880247.1 sugar phosphate isomerase/epimerase [Arthrobacter sp. B2a2-09]